MKVDGKLHTIVNDKCPTCWKAVGEDHDADCWTAELIEKAGKKSIKAKDRDPFENDSEWLKEKVKQYRKERKVDPVERANPTPKPKLGGVGVFVDTVYAKAREEFDEARPQVFCDIAIGFDGHLRDIPGKRIVVDGTMTFHVRAKSQNIGTLHVTTVKREITEIEAVR